MTSTIKVDTISENTSANGVAVDGVTLKDGGIAATDGCTITTDDNTYTLILKSTDADANQGPLLSLHRDSGSPADDDTIGGIQFRFEDDAGNVTSYDVETEGTIVNFTNGVDFSDVTSITLATNNVTPLVTTYNHKDAILTGTYTISGTTVTFPPLDHFTSDSPPEVYLVIAT